MNYEIVDKEDIRIPLLGRLKKYTEIMQVVRKLPKGKTIRISSDTYEESVDVMNDIGNIIPIYEEREIYIEFHKDQTDIYIWKKK